MAWPTAGEAQSCASMKNRRLHSLVGQSNRFSARSAVSGAPDIQGLGRFWLAPYRRESRYSSQRHRRTADRFPKWLCQRIARRASRETSAPAARRRIVQSLFDMISRLTRNACYSGLGLALARALPPICEGDAQPDGGCWLGGTTAPFVWQSARNAKGPGFPGPFEIGSNRRSIRTSARNGACRS